MTYEVLASVEERGYSDLMNTLRAITEKAFSSPLLAGRLLHYTFIFLHSLLSDKAQLVARLVAVGPENSVALLVLNLRQPLLMLSGRYWTPCGPATHA